MEFKTTKEFIVQAHSAACTDWKKRIEKEFPEAFKTQLKVGEWYVSKTQLHDWLMNYQGNSRGYGFNTFKKWGNGYLMHENDEWREAAHEEIESALIAEAKKRGYVGKQIILIDGELSGANSKSKMENDFYCTGQNRLMCQCGNMSYTIFKDGKWAEIIPEEKTTISKEKALKIIAKKLKVSPENIVIE